MGYIAIDGPSGSGKTHLSRELSQRIGAVVYHLDDFGNDFEPFIGIPDLVRALESERADHVIFEGVGVFDQRFDVFEAYRIFMNTGYAVRAARTAARDVPRPDRTTEDWARIIEIWKAAEAEYFTDAIRKKADYTIAESGYVDIDRIAAAVSERRL